MFCRMFRRAGFVFDTFLLYADDPLGGEASIAWHPKAVQASVLRPNSLLLGECGERGYTERGEGTYVRELRGDHDGFAEARWLQSRLLGFAATSVAFGGVPLSRDLYPDLGWGAPWTRWLLNGGDQSESGLRLNVSIAGVREGDGWSTPEEEVLLIAHGAHNAVLSPGTSARLAALGFSCDEGLWLRGGPPTDVLLATLFEL